ncbi:DUF3575 domain-containing protein [Riemerella anatipestifer]|uniref:DUF3575 domain-containing protein n=1 Tax=Riemerella anatipestifer TaxID=34085 RepID=A0AAP6HFI9_RIEAN|nr:DUF3575 domain-containing protein [Riemerella anatipestifer]MBT0549145.1 DUF3575 domain-containing protein [Riemerella anatipestifer]MBT0556142.1 DUF3575 domain-containing protein [Riemerella anatipestifer]MBT0559908.1 DUF3575 domain-containing protein [Riemerella anatipestifer]MCD5968187.1 DUF3575 domain-containing protein [Riemerella anatipestifer]MCO7354425.1 DUF3575 domain-containing protein [Riemerella anatipestifer]
MKNITFILFLGLVTLISAQPAQEETSTTKPKSLYIKGNILTLPLSIINGGLEYQLASKYTIQGDILISPWKSAFGNHMQIYMGHLEGRYYFKKAFSGWYVGANAGAGVFDMTKWNYLDTKKFQRGFNYMIGAVVGYQYQWRDRWNIDFFLGGGTSQGFYHGYEPSEKPPHFLKRYENHPSNWNRSGEWIPYRGGIMISYKLK